MQFRKQNLKAGPKPGQFVTQRERPMPLALVAWVFGSRSTIVRAGIRTQRVVTVGGARCREQ
jgi:hypothetical protein